MENNRIYRTRRGFPPFRFIGWVILGGIGAVVIAFLFGYFVMLLWNWLMPALFGLGEINFWMAVGIVILARLIFGGFKHGHDDHQEKSTFWKSHFRRPRKSSPFEKWRFYDDFWKEEGKEAFNAFVERKQGGSVDSSE